MPRYFAWIDTGHIKALGNCADFETADTKAPSNSLWIFDESALRAFQLDVTNALNEAAGSRTAPVDSNTGRMVLDAAILQYSNLAPGMAVAFGNGAQDTSEPECDEDHLIGYWVEANVFVPVEAVKDVTSSDREPAADCEPRSGSPVGDAANEAQIDGGPFLIVGHARGKGLPDLDRPVSINGDPVMYATQEEATAAAHDLEKRFGHNRATGHRTTYEVRPAAEVI